MNDHLDLDGTLRAAAEDVRREMTSVDVGEFQPSRGPGPAVAVAALGLVILAGLALIATARDRSTAIEVGPAERVVDNTETDDRGDPDAGGDTNPEPAPSPDADAEPDADLDTGTTAVVTGAAIDPATLNTTTDPAPLAAAGEPAVGEPVVDAVFGTEIVRITGDDTSPSAVALPSGASLWNADESLLLLYRPGDQHVLHDGTTGAFIRPVDIPAADIEQVFWSSTDPDLLYHVDGVDFSALDVSTGNSTVLHRFDGCERVDSGRTPVVPSHDDRLWGLVCHRADGGAEWVAYNLDDDREFRLPAPNPDQGPVPSASGDAIVTIDGSTATVYDPTFGTVINSFEFGDGTIPMAAVDADGRDVIIGPQFSLDPTGTLVAVDLATGEATAVVGPDTGHGPAATGVNAVVSGPAQPGLLAVAVRSDGSDSTLVSGEILVVDLTRDLVIRAAHHRAVEEDYFTSPFVAVSRRGDRVVFSGDRGGDGTTDSYLIRLPTRP